MNKATVARARKAHDKIVSAVFACAPNTQTRFSDCLKLASDALRATYDSTQSTLIKAECDAIEKGRAYRSTFGHITWYR